MGVVCGISLYLLSYFFIYTGCEELIRFWVLANLVISIAFTGLRMMYILAREGKKGLKSALSKKKMDESKDKSQSINRSLENRPNFPLKEDFYSIAFFSFILM
jgi:cytosine/uracil/thiamine/allantoin permease